MCDRSKSLDILGIKPVANSISKVTSATLDGAAAFLSRICLPAAEEFGFLLRDRVREWRAAHIAAIAEKAQKRLENSNAPQNVHAHPRLVSEILEEGSWIDDSVVQDMWGGLLSSSCTETGDDDSNLLFINMLSNLTRLEARLLKYICEHANKRMEPNGLIQAADLVITLDVLKQITAESDIHRLDRELDHLREIGLINGGFLPGIDTSAHVSPSPIALHMYVRCQGVRVSPTEYFGLKLKQEDEMGEIETEKQNMDAARFTELTYN